MLALVSTTSSPFHGSSRCQPAASHCKMILHSDMHGIASLQCSHGKHLPWVLCYSTYSSQASYASLLGILSNGPDLRPNQLQGDFNALNIDVATVGVSVHPADGVTGVSRHKCIFSRFSGSKVYCCLEASVSRIFKVTSQNSFTVLMLTCSSGECAPVIVGP